MDRARLLIVLAWVPLLGGALVANYVRGLLYLGVGLSVAGFFGQLLAAAVVIHHTRSRHRAA